MSSLDQLLCDPVEFISRLTIKSKSGKLVRFGDVITPEQIELIRALQANKNIIVIKARQLGISTVVRAYCFWEAYTNRDSVNCAVISNKERSAMNLLDIDRRFYVKLPKSLQRALSVDTKTQIQFQSTQTNLLAMTARADSQDRGYTLNTAHLSEYAFYDNADTYLASLLASINDGKVIIESTPNYFGDALHELIKASTYDSRWHVVFMPWSSFPTYRTDELVTPTPDELELMDRYSLDIEQISWRRHKIAEMKSDVLFRREYPLTIEECWTLDDKCYFTNSDLEHLTKIPCRHGKSVLAPYQHGMPYVIGVDPASGVGQDYSVATVMSKMDYSVVAKLSSNQMGINPFALGVIELSKQYGDALVLFENNNHGHAFREVLNANSFSKYKEWVTTSKSKIALFDQLRTYIKDSIVTYLDELTLSELRMLQSSTNGTAPKHPSGMHDDQVISFALAIEALKYVTVPLTPYEVMLKQMQTKPVVNTSALSAISRRR